MLEPIRLATPEEISGIAAKSDLTPRTSVYAFDNVQTGKPDLAVVRQCVEIDPWFVGKEEPTRRKAAFIWGLENILRAVGATEYYFNIHPQDEVWIHNAKNFGAELVSEQPELRFKKVL